MFAKCFMFSCCHFEWLFLLVIFPFFSFDLYYWMDDNEGTSECYEYKTHAWLRIAKTGRKNTAFVQIAKEYKGKQNYPCSTFM